MRLSCSTIVHRPALSVLVEPKGHRYSIEGRHVNYLGWSFQIAVRPSAGPQLWDIRYRGERIIYELSLQEAFASYGAASVVGANSIYADGAWGMGRSMYEMISGYDCPVTGELLDIVQVCSWSTVMWILFRCHTDLSLVAVA
jgi:Cu2+-containing amine oxidase